MDVEFLIGTFPSCDKFQIFRVCNDILWQINSVPAYNIDTGECEYFDFIFDDVLTAELICKELNQAEEEL